MSGATNVRQIRGAFILPGHHLWGVGAGGYEWAGPRITGTFYDETSGEIEISTWNGGRAYVLPSDLITVCDCSDPRGDVLS